MKLGGSGPAFGNLFRVGTHANFRFRVTQVSPAQPQPSPAQPQARSAQPSPAHSPAPCPGLPWPASRAGYSSVSRSTYRQQLLNLKCLYEAASFYPPSPHLCPSPRPEPSPRPTNSRTRFQQKTCSKLFGHSFRSKRFGQNVFGHPSPYQFLSAPIDLLHDKFRQALWRRAAPLQCWAALVDPRFFKPKAPQTTRTTTNLIRV